VAHAGARVERPTVGEVIVKQAPTNLLETTPATLLASLVLAACFYGACEPDDGQLQNPGSGITGGTATTGGAAVGSGLDAGLLPGTAGGTFGAVGGVTGGAITGGGVTGGPITGATTGGGATLAGAGITGGMTGTAGAAGGTMGMNPGMTSHDHCMFGYPADPRDSQITNAPDEWRASNGAIDLVLPKAVVTWMEEGLWEKSHDAWHNIRRCSSGLGGFGGGGFIGGLFGGGAGGGVNVCAQTAMVPADQECENAADGYAFLVMHRHMMQGLRQAFPTHADLFKGFTKFPRQAADVPAQWQARWSSGWSAQITQVANVLEGIEQNLSQFATEGDLGRYIQCGGSGGASSIHGALHFKWVVAESPHSLGDQTVNIDNFMFWKLHGWIDDIWERYRVAKGLKPDEAKLTQALYGQCMEMHNLAHLFEGGGGTSPDAGVAPLPTESGYFHEQVRPIFDKYCMGCHRGSSPEAGLALAGQISSASIVSSLVGRPSTYGGQFQRVVAGNPNQSWLYLKVTGMSASAGCTGAACRTGVMPPAGQVTLTAAELEIIRKWIADGAPAPTQP
jgi:hypothetical protein